jgi:hypothetical protein
MLFSIYKAVRCQLFGFHFFTYMNIFDWATNELQIYSKGCQNSNFIAYRRGKAVDGTPIVDLVSENPDTSSLLSRIQRFVTTNFTMEMKAMVKFL